MNRALFNNCGISGNSMATILEGIAKVKDFKSIIYKHGELNSLAVSKFERIFHKFVPDQLMELQIIDCKIHCSVIEQLLDLMIAMCEVRSFTLVNVHHSEGSFKKLCDYVQSSPRLRELNVSWQCLRPVVFYRLIEVIRDQRTLCNLVISWNIFLDEQPTALTEKQIA